jgi:preprotein translocase subunit SecA
MVQRGHHYAIVDEVDSILIDEARTPLIISGPASDVTKLYYQFASIARALVRDVDYEVDEEKKTVVPTEAGIEKVEKQLGVTNLYDAVSTNYVHQLGQALRAKELYHRDKEYLVDAGEVKIVDEFTGRTLDGRRWSDGLHQAVEAKERVRIQEENHTWATVTLQNYFRMYEKLAGMTGTAETEAASSATPTALGRADSVEPALIRLDQPDLIYKTEEAKFAAIVDDVRERSDRGQPVLLGTASVEKSELLSRALSKAGIPTRSSTPSSTSAKPRSWPRPDASTPSRWRPTWPDEAWTSCSAATSRASPRARPRPRASRPAPRSSTPRTRGAGEFRPSVRPKATRCAPLGGLYVLGSERHDSRRIDNQLRGRSGRQGDPGESRFYLSLQDDLLRLFATGAVSWVMDRTMPDDLPIEAKMVSKAIERAQNTVEGKNAEIRKDTQVRRSDERTAQGHLRTAPAGHRRRGHPRRHDRDDRRAPHQRRRRPTRRQFAEDWDINAADDGTAELLPDPLNADALAEYEDRDDIVALVIDDAVALREEVRELPRRYGHGQGDRARRHAPDPRPALARAPLGHGLPARRHPPGVRSPSRTRCRRGRRRATMFEAPPRQGRQADFVRYITHVEASAVRRSRTPRSTRDSRAPSPTPNIVAPGATELPRTVLSGEDRCPSRGDKIGRNEPCWCGSGASSSSAMADPKAENALREAVGTLGEPRIALERGARLPEDRRQSSAPRGTAQ